MKKANGIAAKILGLCLLLWVFAPAASADVTIAEPGDEAGQVDQPRGLAVDSETGRLYVADSGNRRVDAFDSEGNFEFAWGWGVADGSPEPQTCGPEATPPTVECLKGIPGGGAGQFANSPVGLYDIAVDNDPGSPSHHAVYVVDSAGSRGGSTDPNDTRVQKFDSDGNFLLAFGGGVVDGGAAGTGELTAGSPTVADVVTTAKAFRVSQLITGTGIPAGTTIREVGEGTLTLSQPATATATGVALTVPEGPGNVPVNEVDVFAGLPDGRNISFTSPAPDGIGALTGATGEGLLHPESTSVTEVTTSRGVFLPGEELACCGGQGPSKPLAIGEYLITSFNSGTGNMTLSLPTNPVVPNAKVQLQAYLRPESPSAFVQAALEAMPNLEPGDITVSGPDGGPYELEFKGPRYSDTDVAGIGVETSAGGFGGPLGVPAPEGASGAEICQAANAWSCSQGIEGSGEGQFAVAAELAVGPGGTVYLADSVPASTSGVENRLQTFTPTGEFIDEFALPEVATSLSGLAVDTGGNFYVAARSDQAIRKYDASGTLLREDAVAGSRALVTNAGGDVFSREPDGRYETIAERDAAGNVLRRFGYKDLGGSEWGRLAPYQSPSGDIYAVGGSPPTVLHLSYPDPGPIVAPEVCQASPVGNTRATLRTLVNPEGQPTTFHFEYVDQASFEAEGFAGPNTIVSPQSESIGSDYALHDAAQQVDVLPETTYHCRVVAENDDQADVVGDPGAFTTLPPFEIAGTWVSGVGADRAALNASVNPLGSPVSGWFEWVDEETYQQSGFADAARTPVPPAELDFGAGENPKTASVELAGLEPNTRYRIRLAVDAHVIEVRYGKTLSFRTRPPGADEAPDGRSYELVSPVEKNGAEIAAPNSAGGGTGIRAVAPSGEAVTFASFTAFADPEAAPTPSQYIARRGASGWTTRNLNLPGLPNRYGVPQQGFTPSLDFAASLVYEPPLTPDCASGYENLYWRDTRSGGIACLTAETPQASAKFCPVFSGASADGSEVFFGANGSMAGAPKGNGFSLYRWSEADGVGLVSVLPNGSPAIPRANTGFGGARYGAELCNALGSLGGAISEDGGQAFWTYGSEYAGSQNPLFASPGDGPTVQLDAVQGGVGPGGGGIFAAASADGSVAFFTDPNQLTADASGGTDLYRYDLSSSPGERLENLTPGGLTGGSETAAVLGVVDAAEDGSRVYFAAKGDLTGAEANGAGEVAQPGQPNLYLWEQGAGVRFLATLAAGDDVNWTSQMSERASSSSPDGLHLAFTSLASLTGYDNTDQTGSPYREVYLYDATDGNLSCVSCNRTGESPTGEASLPGWSNPVDGPRYLSADGSRLFFQSADDLTSVDENGLQDVYEFERPGSGTCTTAARAYDDVAEGCVYLLSRGLSGADSYLLGASSDGRDVMFSTRERLLLSDQDERYDIYDYRVHGFPAPVPPAPPCQGEACRPPATSPPGPASSPATPFFVGPGNQVRRACLKGRVRRKGHCVRKKRRHSKSKKHRRGKGSKHKNHRGGAQHGRAVR